MSPHTVLFYDLPNEGSTRLVDLSDRNDPGVGRGPANQGRWLMQSAWQGGPRLVQNTLIESSAGAIVSVSDGTSREGVPHAGVALPGLVNAHSHAFHRLLRGNTHRPDGDFWAWRQGMYEVASGLTPESYEELATAVYVEMALAGITTVGEFHYVHHQAGGIPYSDPNEMGHALIRAARRAGIRICVLDTGYFSAGFGREELSPVQERFRDATPDDWLDRVEALAAHYGDAPDVVIGIAPHSVRAVPREGLERLSERRGAGTPVHIHVSEQPAENDECLAATSLTPTGLLAETGVLTPGTTLVHATHVTPGDVALIGASGAGVCYCATTERDLADGIGPAARLSSAGAPLCVGSDSHAIIDIFEEARGLEMHQRLESGARGLIAPDALAEAMTTSGSGALGFDDGGLAAGSPADFVVINVERPGLAGLDLSGPIDRVVFSATAADVSEVFIGGVQVVTNGSHPAWEQARGVLRTQ